jgi:TrmH family RNA methyltransferase
MSREPLAAAVAAARRDPALVVLEGFHAVKHAVRFGADLVHLVTSDPNGAARLAEALAPDVADVLARAEPIDAGSFAALAPHPIPTPVLAVARRPDFDPAFLTGGAGRVVLLDRPNHLGNVGAAVRVAAAAGAAAVVSTGDRDPWDAAALRGSAGLHFALPVGRLEGPPETGRPLVALHPDGEPLGATPLPLDALLAFGSERSGLHADLLDRADRRIAIPMRPGVSSLNLATAVAVVLYAGLPPA